jgi:hypothetical protein
MQVSKRKPSPPRAPKARGELAEARFIAKALSLGLFVSKPFGDSLPYDFIVEAGGKLSRVQVKSAWCATPRGAFQFVASPIQNRGQHAHPYRGHEIDFFVAYINPADTWFVIPVARLRQMNHLHLSLATNHPFARYREAWHLLERVSIHASAEVRRMNGGTWLMKKGPWPMARCSMRLEP